MSGFTVALIGADGAGKTTICRKVVATLPLPMRYLYMGVNAEASNVMLPTTRFLNSLKRARGSAPTGGPPDPSREVKPRGGLRRSIHELRSFVSLGLRLAEEWYRQGLAWYHVARGRVVLFDRHFFTDYYAHDIVGSARTDRSLARTIHGFALERLYPRPDLVILLDAPPEVLWQRKPEGTFAAVTRRRNEYLQLEGVCPHFVVIDATQPRDVVLQAVIERILEHARARQGGSSR
jgi:thymidylate kinase